MGYDLKWLHDTYLNDIKFIRLVNDWAKSGYKKAKKPSIDRINNKKGYEKTNIHMMTWAENRFKQSMERRSRKGKVIQKLNGTIVKVWKSQREAWKSLNISQSMLSYALNSENNKAYGYEWEWEIGNIHENSDLL